MIEYIEKLKQRLDLHTLGDVESLCKSHVEIDERWTRKSVSSCAWAVVNRVKGSIAIWIFRVPAVDGYSENHSAPERSR